MDHIREQQVMDWYEQYYDDIYRFIFFMMGDRQCCEDLVHDTFVRAYSAAERFREKSTVKTWLFSIAKHLVLDEIRRRKRRRMLSLIHGKDIPSALDLEEYVENRDTVQRVMVAIQKLKPNYRLVITLKKIDDCSTKEISEILGWTEAKVRKTLSRGIAALKKLEESEGGEQIEQSIS